MSVTCWLSVHIHGSVAYPILANDMKNLSWLPKCTPSIILIYQPLKLWNSQISCPIWQMSIPQVCHEKWAIIGIAMIWCISEQLWGITCNKHCCDAFIQIKWVLFCIAMYWLSGYYLILACGSGETPVFWNPVPGHKVACQACVQVPDVVRIVNTERHCCDSQKYQSSEVNRLIVISIIRWNVHR